MPTQTKILACIHVTLGSIGLACGLIMLVLMAGRLDGRNLQTYQFIGFVLLVISVVYLIPAVAGGIGLLRRKRWAWLVMIVVSVLQLPLIPIGTVLGGYGLWVLLSKDKRPARAASASGSDGPGWLSRNGALLLIIAGVGAGFAVMLQAGFWFNHQTAPAEITSVLPFAVVTLVVIAGVIASGHWPNQGRGQPIFQGGRLRGLLSSRSSAGFEQAERQRLAKLAADPVLCKYVALIEAGEYWPDERIAYAEDANRVATCTHLQPVERAMRGAGIAVRLQNGVDITAACRIHLETFNRLFGHAASALYLEQDERDRSRFDTSTAWFRCGTCLSHILVIHPDEADPQTPWFPALDSAPATAHAHRS